MSASDSWFERNEGFINFAGHLVAIGQRNALIQQQGQTQAILQQGVTLEQQRRADEARQENCKNLLYDINQATGVVRDEYSTRPQQAYYEAILLNEKIKQIDLNHGWFSELEWKNYCTETKRAVVELVEQASKCLSPQQINSVEEKIRIERQQEEEKWQTERNQTILRRAARKKARQEAEKAVQEACRLWARRLLIGSAFAFGLGVLISMVISESAAVWLFGIAFLLLMSGCFAAFVGSPGSASDKTDLRQLHRSRKGNGRLSLGSANDKTDLRQPQNGEQKQREQTSGSKPALTSFGPNTFTVDLASATEDELDEVLGIYTTHPAILKVIYDDGKKRVYQVDPRGKAEGFKKVLVATIPGIRVAQFSG